METQEQMTVEQLMAQIEALKARNAELEANQPRPKGLVLKVSEKGGVSIYGLGKFPVTQYMSTWLKIFEHREQIEAFIQENVSRLAVKESKK